MIDNKSHVFHCQRKAFQIWERDKFTITLRSWIGIRDIRMNPRDSLQNNLPMFDKNVNVIKDEEMLDFKKTEKKKTERCDK